MGPREALLYSTRVGHDGANEYAAGFIIHHNLNAPDGVIVAIYDWERGEQLHGFGIRLIDKDNLEIRCPSGCAAPKGGLRVVVAG